eukprot:6178226-Pleurochrysis_carterae.AAC.5
MYRSQGVRAVNHISPQGTVSPRPSFTAPILGATTAVDASCMPARVLACVRLTITCTYTPIHVYFSHRSHAQHRHAPAPSCVRLSATH